MGDNSVNWSVYNRASRVLLLTLDHPIEHLVAPHTRSAIPVPVAGERRGSRTASSSLTCSGTRVWRALCGCVMGAYRMGMCCHHRDRMTNGSEWLQGSQRWCVHLRHFDATPSSVWHFMVMEMPMCWCCLCLHVSHPVIGLGCVWGCVVLDMCCVVFSSV